MDRTNFVNDKFDLSVKELQSCTASSGNSTEIIYHIGFSRSVRVDGVIFENPMCPDEIYWLNSKEHFTATSPLEGSFDFGRETIEDDSERAQTEAGQITETKTLTVKGEHSSELLKMFRNIKISDQTGGYGTKLLKAYSNGGLHLKTVYRNLETGAEITEFAMNVKSSTWVEMFTSFESDSEVDIELLVENDMYYMLDGDDFYGETGLPEEDLKLVPTITQEATNITIEMDITDTYEILDANYMNVLISVFNESKSVKEVYSTKSMKGDIVTIAIAELEAEAGDMLAFDFSFFAGANYIVPAGVHRLQLDDTTVVTPVISADATASTVSGTALSDEELITLFNATVTEGATLIVDQAAVDYNTPADYNVVFSAVGAVDVTSTLTVTAAKTVKKTVKK